MRVMILFILLIAAFLSGGAVASMILPVTDTEGGSVKQTESNYNTDEQSNSPKAFSPVEFTRMITTGRAPERASPFDWIAQDAIHVYDDRVVIYLDNPEWAYFTNTNSMDPVLDETSNAIEIVPKFPDQVHIGDIASYKDGDETIIHRVIGKGKDSKGVFFIMKGDNNPTKDPGKVRFEQIQRVVVAVIY